MNITSYLKDHILILDGGMGTLLQERGLLPGERTEVWNLTHPDRIKEVHLSYLQAGAQMISANTFGANSLHYADGELERVIAAGLSIARAAVEEAGTGAYVALDIGPTGRMLKPYGDLDFEEAVAIFAKSVRLGAQYGADLILIETMNDSYETKAALLAAKENSTLPVFVSNAYGADGKLMTGADPHAMVAMLEGLGADAIGVNCSLGPRALLPVVESYLTYASVPVLVKPNAGLPSVVNQKTVYDVTPDAFAAVMAEMAEKGVRALGGCCGTTPAYIAALAGALASVSPMPLTQKRIPCISSYTHAVTFGHKPVLIGERINPTGKKRLKEALRSRDLDHLLQEGIGQEAAGADVLDVNVGLPDIDEVQMLTDAVTGLQAVVDLPLQIDSGDPLAMERALRRYNGKAMINSVSGKQESMDAIFPLAKKYGGLVVALTLDEQGIPKTTEGRLSIAERILGEAERHGLCKHDLIFDPLCMAVSADPNAARVTLEAVELIGKKLGCLTSLGISNVSFGLPARDALNGAFFTLALQKGLSAAIVNPHSLELQKAYRGYCALAGLDENCADYIAFSPALESSSAIVSVAKRDTAEEGIPDLAGAIEKGRSQAAKELTHSLLARGEASMDIVSRQIIPALDAVGKGFEEKRIYLPQLLMSAEAAKSAFSVIRENTPGGSGHRMPVVLATVKGDIHDIGKNIVKLLLQNYGFSVTDLGHDVDPVTVVEAVERTGAPLVGLSALMTTTVPAMEETVALLKERCPHTRVVVGGAVLTKSYAERLGAHAYAADAMETVRYAEEVERAVKR